jgi:hypothetical protein
LRTAARAALALVLAAAPGRAAGPRFFPDDPVQVERDFEDASGARPWEIDLIADLTLNLFGRPGDPTPDVRAQNVNTVDEVPDSSWFTNRAGTRPLTPEEIERGPDTTSGPAPGRWTVTSSKSDGVTPGFTIRDTTDQLWFLKFDAPGRRGMATGTEVAVTKLLWALGYHVPENHIAYLQADQLVVGNGARFTPPQGDPRPMRPSDIAALLERADRETDGTYRVVASRAIDRVLGGFRFYGTRPDDPNDIVPHEHRRELRGYGVFSAWLNHVDAKAINSMDALATEGGRTVVRHYLLDFGSTLGSASVAPREAWEGFEYLVERRQTLKEMAGFGLVIAPWRTIEFFESPSVGRFPLDNRQFDPDRWKPRVPNPAFLRARGDDRFWAARKLSALTDDLLRAAVRAADLDDPASEVFLVRALAERRDAIVRAYLPAVNPIVAPALDADVLTFRNAAVDAAVAPPPDGYRAVWFAFDNATGDRRPLAETSGSGPRLPTPDQLPDGVGSYVHVEISAVGGSRPSWSRPIDVYFVRESARWRLAGLERMR